MTNAHFFCSIKSNDVFKFYLNDHVSSPRWNSTASNCKPVHHENPDMHGRQLRISREVIG